MFFGAFFSMKLTSSDSNIDELLEAFLIIAAVCGLFLAAITGAGGARVIWGGKITGMLFTRVGLTFGSFGLGVWFSFELSDVVATSLSTSAKLAPYFL